MEKHSSTQHQELNLDTAYETSVSNNTRNIIMNHLGSFQNNDLGAVVADYTNESVLVTQEATYKGPEELKGFFATLITHFPKQKSSFELDKMVVVDTMGYIVWHANTPSLEVFLGTDTFIIKDGKICQQTFCGQMKFK